MNIYTYICFLSAISILICFVTHKVSDRIQYTIAVTATSMVFSIILMLFGSMGWFKLDTIARSVMEQIDFKEFLLNGILGFLLFGGALGIKLPVLKSQKYEISVLSIFSTFASTFLIGFFIYGFSKLLGFHIDFV